MSDTAPEAATAARSAAGSRDGAPPTSRRRWYALTVLCTAYLMIVLDGSIVTVALPAIQSDLGFSPSGLTWTINAYMITFGGLLLLAGRLGDLAGRRRVLLTGLAVFTAASVLCALAATPAMLVAARFAQGVGGALASAVSLGIIVTLFTDPGERGRAIGAYAFTGATGAALGAALGGLLTDAFGWRWVFFINVPIGLLAIVGTVRLLADDPGIGLRRGADASGGALITAGGMLTVYTIVQIEAHGWASARTLGLAAGSLALLAAFVARQATAAAPLMPLRILRVRNVWGANAVQMLLVAAMFGFQIHMALYLQQVRGYDATETGLALMPAAVVIGGVSLTVSGRLIARFGERAVLVSGLIIMVAGYALLTRLSVDTAYATHVLPVTLLLGGFGLALPALTALGMSSAGQDDAGAASGVFNTTQQIGAALGVAVLAAFAASRTAHLRDDGVPEALALTGGFRLAFGVGAGLLVAAIVLGLLVLRRAPAEGRS